MRPNVFSASLEVDIGSDFRLPIAIDVDFYHASQGVARAKRRWDRRGGCATPRGLLAVHGAAK